MIFKKERIFSAVRTQDAKFVAFAGGLLASIVWYGLTGFKPLTFPLGGLVGFYLYFKMLQGDKVILWFRRFHQEDAKSSRFHQYLASATRELGSVITIQDSQFKHTYWVSFSISILLPFLLVWVIGIVAIVVFIRFPTPAAFALNIAGMVLLLMAFIIYVRRSSVRTIGKNHMSVLVRILMGVQERIRLRMGILIVKCKDEIWQTMVKQALNYADLAIVDITNISENVIWELETSLNALPAHAVVLAYATDDNTANVKHRTKIIKQLEEVISEDQLKEVRYFPYPSKLSKEIRGTTFKEYRDKLELLLIEAVPSRNQKKPQPEFPSNRDLSSFFNHNKYGWNYSAGVAYWMGTLLLPLLSIAFLKLTNFLGYTNFDLGASIGYSMDPTVLLIRNFTGIFFGCAFVILLTKVRNNRILAISWGLVLSTHFLFSYAINSFSKNLLNLGGLPYDVSFSLTGSALSIVHGALLMTALLYSVRIAKMRLISLVVGILATFLVMTILRDTYTFYPDYSYFLDSFLMELPSVVADAFLTGVFYYFGIRYHFS